MNGRRLLVALAGGAFALACGVAATAATATAPEAPKTYEADKGPDKVDVSRYPAHIQSAYLAFATNCAKCHTLARAINTDKHASQWRRYVARMLQKPDSGVAVSDGKKIREFLVYHQNAKDKQRGIVRPKPAPPKTGAPAKPE